MPNSSYSRITRSPARQRTPPWIAGIGPFLHQAGEKRLVLFAQLARRARRRFVDQPVWPLIVEPDHPVSQGLPIHAAVLRRLFPRGTVEHCCNRKEPARLSGVPYPRRQTTKLLARKVRPHRNRSPHGKRPSVCHLESCCR